MEKVAVLEGKVLEIKSDVEIKSEIERTLLFDMGSSLTVLSILKSLEKENQDWRWSHYIQLFEKSKDDLYSKTSRMLYKQRNEFDDLIKKYQNLINKQNSVD